MRASSVLPGFLTSEWRDSNPRPRGPQPRALPTAPHSVARRPGLEPGSTVLETAVLAIAPPTQRKVSTAPRASARSSGRQMPRTPPKSPEPDSNRRPAAYEAAALPLGHRGKAVPPIAFSMHVESLSARVPCRARHGRDRLVEPAGFGPATFPLRTGCAASAPRPHASPPLCGKGWPEKESFRWRRYAAGALGRIRTGDAHLRRVALYPLSYGGLRRPAYAWLSHRPPFWPALVRAPERKAARRSAPAFALLLGRAFNASVHAPRRRECSNTLLLYGTSCVPTCPRPDSNRRRPPPGGGALSAELRGRMPPTRRPQAFLRVGGIHVGSSVLDRPCGMAAFSSVRWCLTRIPRGRF